MAYNGFEETHVELNQKEGLSGTCLKLRSIPKKTPVEKRTAIKFSRWEREPKSTWETP